MQAILNYKFRGFSANSTFAQGCTGVIVHEGGVLARQNDRLLFNWYRCFNAFFIVFPPSQKYKPFFLVKNVQIAEETRNLVKKMLE